MHDGEPSDLRERLTIAALPLSTGAAVLVTILIVHDSLLVPTLVLVAGSAAAAVVAARRLSPARRAEIRRRVRIGVVAGVAATLVYDLVRYVIVSALSWSVSPFGAFPIFGTLLIGGQHSTAALWAAGITFHLLNGLGFAVGYTVVFSRPRLVTAVAWALVLETFTILLYPNWLGITAVSEFFSMSMLGHVGYGLTLGCVAQRGITTVEPQRERS